LGDQVLVQSTPEADRPEPGYIIAELRALIIIIGIIIINIDEELLVDDARRIRLVHDRV
jgi:hypothetical protein